MPTQMERIMAEASEIKDPAVAVHLARIEGKMEGMKASSDSLGKQLESVVSELREVSKISQRYQTHDESVKRIWEEIDKRDRKWDERFEKLDSTSGITKDRVNRIFWFSSGVSSVAAILLGLVLWILNGEMAESDRSDQRLDSIEIHLAGDQVRPYKPR